MKPESYRTGDRRIIGSRYRVQPSGDLKSTRRPFGRDASNISFLRLARARRVWYTCHRKDGRVKRLQPSAKDGCKQSKNFAASGLEASRGDILL
jgi:hypothetical protein